MKGTGKAGSILIIIGSAFMILLGFIFSVAGLATVAVGFGAVAFLGVLNLVFGIINIVLAAINLAGKKDLILASGIIALVSIFFGWFALFFPIVLLLIGGILVLCGRDDKKEITDEEIKVSVEKQVEIS